MPYHCAISPVRSENFIFNFLLFLKGGGSRISAQALYSQITRSKTPGWGPYGIPGIKPKLAAYKAFALLTMLLPWPLILLPSGIEATSDVLSGPTSSLGSSPPVPALALPCPPSLAPHCCDWRATAAGCWDESGCRLSLAGRRRTHRALGMSQRNPAQATTFGSFC